MKEDLAVLFQSGLEINSERFFKEYFAIKYQNEMCYLCCVYGLYW